MARECKGEVSSFCRRGSLLLCMALGACILFGCGPEGKEMNDSKGTTGETPKSSRLIKETEQDGLVFYSFHFTGGDGREVTAWAAFPASWGECPCVMIYFHRAAEDPGVVKDLGPMAARSGWGVVAMPSPGRPERPCEEGEDPRALALADAHACVEALQILPEFERSPLLTACGASLGAPIVFIS